MKIKSTKAAILVNQNQPLVVDNIDLPPKLDFGQVLVRLNYSGICGSQLGEIDGVKGKDHYLPHLLGHEGSGTVIEVGSGVKKVKEKDKVILHWKKSSGIESNVPTYKWKGKKINAGWVTTFNDYAIISENRCTPIGIDVDLKIASLFGCAITTGFGAIENKANLKMGENVLVFGAGGIGLNIIQAAKFYSANQIIAVDIFDNKLELAKLLGATDTINSKKTNFKDAIPSIVNNSDIDVFIDNTGNPEIIEYGYKIISKNGRVVLVGVPKFNKNISIHSLSLHFGKTISGTYGGDGNIDNDIPRYLRLVSNGKLVLDEIISDTFELKNINEAINNMRIGNISGRCIVKLN